MYVLIHSFLKNMEIKKIKIDENEYIFIENIKLGFLDLSRCIADNGENVFIISNKNKLLENRILLGVLNKKYKYEIKTDICENNDE